MTEKKTLVLIALIVSILAWRSPYAQAASKGEAEAWRVLEEAEYAYENGEFGEALKLCDKARLRHESTINSYISILTKAIIPSEVKHAGDGLDAVYAILEKRNDSSALSVLDTLYLVKPPKNFGNSLQKLLSWLHGRIVYPEADILAAKVYEAEGELIVARTFYEKAWQSRAFLEVPDDWYTIAYRMAEISERQGDYGAQEKYLLLVLTGDPVFGAPGKESQTLLAMMRTIRENSSLDKFFSLYRHDAMPALSAYQDLSYYYYRLSGKRIDRAFPVAVLASCTSITALSRTVSLVDFQYVYRDFNDLLVRSGKSAKVIKWATDNRIWDSFMLFASIMYEDGERDQAMALWDSLASYCPDAVVARKASGELLKRTPDRMLD